jgi:hypothetical protein
MLTFVRYCQYCTEAWNDLDHNVPGVNAEKLCKALKAALRKIFIETT